MYGSLNLFNNLFRAHALQLIEGRKNTKLYIKTCYLNNRHFNLIVHFYIDCVKKLEFLFHFSRIYRENVIITLIIR